MNYLNDRAGEALNRAIEDQEENRFRLSKEKCIEVLNIDENVNSSPIQLLKKDTILLYVGKCRESKIISAKGEKWVGKKDIYERHFGYIVDFILPEEKLHVTPKIGDIVYCDPFTGELLPFEKGNELLYFKVVKLDEINIIIK